MFVENVGFGVQLPELRSGLCDPGQVTVSLSFSVKYSNNRADF